MSEEQKSERRRVTLSDHQSQLPRLVEAVFYVIMAVTFGTLFVWYNEGPPMVVVERTLLTPQVEVGEVIKVYNEVNAHKECPVTVNRTLIDSIGVIYTITPLNVWPDEQIGELGYTSEIVVPLGASPGIAIYRVSLHWECNPLQEVFTPTVALNDLKVEIVL